MNTQPSQPQPPQEGRQHGEFPLLRLAEVSRLDPATPGHAICWVEGEISDLSTPDSGHQYFRLCAEEDVRMPAVLFRSVAARCSVVPRSGLVVLALVVPQENPLKARQLELVVHDLRVLDACGPLQAGRNALHDRLRSEGLFEPGRKRALPTTPTRVAVIASPTGEAVHDVLQVLRRRAPGLSTQIVAAAASGERAPAEISAALRLVSSLGIADLVILARGGGPEHELAAYDAECVVRAIAGSAVPVITAIGHERDTTLADAVADVRCATPTAAAEHVASLLATAEASVQPSDAPLLTLRAGELHVSVHRCPTDAEEAI